MTKDGSVAGPKTLEHLVDTVLTLEGDKQSAFRLLHAGKNRFGSTDEVGIFEMVQTGLQGVDNPSARFLEERGENPGSVVTCIMEGTRPILVEVQALAEKSVFANPIRRTSGYDSSRLQMLLAIINRHANIPVYGFDVYVNIVGGIKIKEPSADLAICGAIISSIKNKSIQKNTILFGELGLSGEMRNVPFQEKRAKEATRLGFSNIISPKTVKSIIEFCKNLE
jgi:DNA repair protein RadA/Sms